jgi:hypothetical protein
MHFIFIPWYKIPLIPLPPLKSGHKSNLYHGIKRFFGVYAMALFSRLYGNYLMYMMSEHQRLYIFE